MLKDYGSKCHEGYKQTCYPGDGNLFAAAPFSTFTDWFNLDDVIFINRQRELKRCAVSLHHTGPTLSALLVHYLENKTAALNLNLYETDH